MAFRFRRSVKLGKGLRLNVSKKGVGMSVGKTGMRYSMHSTGSKTKTLGIPGTGLSYVKQTRSGQKKSTNKKASQSNTGENQAVVQEFNTYIHAMTHLHEEAPTATNWKEINALPAPFDHGEMGPEEIAAAKDYHEYQPNFVERLIKPLAKKRRHELKASVEQARAQDQATYEAWQAKKALATEVLAGNPQAYKEVVQTNPELTEAIERGLSIRVPAKNQVEVEIQLDPSEVIPNRTLSLTKTGKVSKRKMGKTNYYKLVKDFVCGYTLWTARTMFASLPIESCTIHVTENKRNSATGHRENKVLLSVQIDQSTLTQLNFDYVDPSDAMENFPHHMNHLKTKGFRAVERIPSL